MIKIGVDAMGGDYAPEAAVKGAVMALDAIGSDSRIVLFGDEEKLSPCSLRRDVPPSGSES